MWGQKDQELELNCIFGSKVQELALLHNMKYWEGENQAQVCWNSETKRRSWLTADFSLCRWMQDASLRLSTSLCIIHTVSWWGRVYFPALLAAKWKLQSCPSVSPQHRLLTPPSSHKQEVRATLLFFLSWKFSDVLLWKAHTRFLNNTTLHWLKTSIYSIFSSKMSF